ncbi:MAG: nucleotidyltransferase family protein [Ignavibacteriales bacterium]|nr:nucleotidyltransferase family protein [Ignavibacteriales bacterium]
MGALILAAGRGRRAGTPKLTMRTDGKSYLRTIGMRLLECGIGPVAVTVAAEFEAWASNEIPGAIVVVNPDPDRGMMSSIAAAVPAMPRTKGIMMIPVDHPFVAEKSYLALRTEFEKNPHRIVKPSYEGKAGHPVIVPWTLAEKIPANDMEGGLQMFLHRSGVEICIVSVTDQGIVQNMNGPL